MLFLPPLDERTAQSIAADANRQGAKSPLYRALDAATNPKLRASTALPMALENLRASMPHVVFDDATKAGGNDEDLADAIMASLASRSKVRFARCLVCRCFFAMRINQRGRPRDYCLNPACKEQARPSRAAAMKEFRERVRSRNARDLEKLLVAIRANGGRVDQTSCVIDGPFSGKGWQDIPIVDFRFRRPLTLKKLLADRSLRERIASWAEVSHLVTALPRK
jgi:hypothetical protein